METITKLLALIPAMVPALIAFNVILSGLGSLLHAIKQNSAESVVGKIAGLLKKLIDMIQGNVAH